MNADNATFGKFSVGGTAIAIDDIAAIAKKAGDKIMEIYNAPDFSEKIKDPKADGSPLTMADLAANDIICSSLKKLYPDIPIISEEIKNAAYADRKDWKHFFCVDPLDGTKEFIKRNGEFTVNIGLCEEGSPIAGVVYCPALSPPVMYKGVKNGGPPIKEECDAVGGAAGYDSFKTIQPKVFSEDDSGLTLVASASHNTPETDAFIAKFKNPKRVSKGSSLKLLMVAEGTAHIYPRLAPTSEWDTCAAQAIVECAGGKVLQAEGGQPCEAGKPVRYNKENILNPHFIVYGKMVPKKKKVAKKEVSMGGDDEEAAPANNNMLIAAVVGLAAVAFFALSK
jgi:3'(2'), 5'-bisphosphate nucleotidase